MSRPKKLLEETKTYNLTIPIILFDRLAKISTMETENDIRHISIAELIRTSIEIYCDAYEQNFDKEGNIRGQS
jgi:hypothetical protein